MPRAARLRCLAVAACRNAFLLLAAGAALACRGAHGTPGSASFDPTQPPEQRPLDAALEGDADAPPAELAGARLEPQARYRIAARVLSSERYYLGWRSELSPLDLALGWGAMSDARVDRFIEWHQGGRWYFWQWSAGSPYQNEAIRTQSANVHVIAGSENLRRALLALDRNDSVQLSGWLVDARGPDGELWNTSMSRTDKGNHSCEIMYVSELVDGAGTSYH